MNDSVRPTVRADRLRAGVLILILLLAMGLRFYGLGSQSLWNDEGTSIAVAQRSLVTIARDAAQDIHPPLYYWLLHGWIGLVGTGEVAVRSLSALLGVILVGLTYLLGRMLAGRWVGLAAAAFAAANPFQIYYAQEARMYMLLAVLTAAAALMLAHLVRRESLAVWLTLVLLETAGLYTHYSFLFVVLILNLAYLLWLGLSWDQRPETRRLVVWGLGQGAVVLLYLPWLPIAVRQATGWPDPEQTTALLPALLNTWRWLTLGPAIETGETAIALPVAALLAVIGAFSLAGVWPQRSGAEGRPAAQRRSMRWAASLLLLWLVVPVALMFILGLYREAYLKFLLVATPAVTLLLACSVALPSPKVHAEMSRANRIAFYGLRFAIYGSVLLLPSNLALQNYYTNPTYARDDYRAIAAYVGATGRPGDAVLLNAPGQQEVFGYYYHGDLPVYPLPESRPLDPAATTTALEGLARPGARVFAVLWATDESDPERFVEGWLDRNTYKAIDSWYGNVRLAVYAVPARTPVAPSTVLDVPLRDPETGDEIALLGYSLLDGQLAAGDIAQITLFWQAEQTPSRRYKVFVHVLNSNNHIAGQRDTEPGGGARLTTLWQPGETIADHYGVPIHPATPPGEYRVEVGMYDMDTGRRLLTPEGASQVWLDPLAVARPPAPAPTAALGMQHDRGAEFRTSFGTLTLLGYDTYKLGYAHQPDARLLPGDTLYTGLYWQAASSPGGDWGVALALVDAHGKTWTAIDGDPVAGYPTSLWQAGDVWRGQFSLLIPATAPPDRYRLEVQLIAPDGSEPEPFQSDPIQVGP